MRASAKDCRDGRLMLYRHPSRFTSRCSRRQIATCSFRSPNQSLPRSGLQHRLVRSHDRSTAGWHQDRKDHDSERRERDWEPMADGEGYDEKSLLALALVALVAGALSGLVGAMFRLCLEQADRLRNADRVCPWLGSRGLPVHCRRARGRDCACRLARTPLFAPCIWICISQSRNARRRNLERLNCLAS